MKASLYNKEVQIIEIDHYEAQILSAVWADTDEELTDNELDLLQDKYRYVIQKYVDDMIDEARHEADDDMGWY